MESAVNDYCLQLVHHVGGPVRVDGTLRHKQQKC